jgi:hypothetical protein
MLLQIARVFLYRQYGFYTLMRDALIFHVGKRIKSSFAGSYGNQIAGGNPERLRAAVSRTTPLQY